MRNQLLCRLGDAEMWIPHTQQGNLEERPRGCKEEANSGAGGPPGSAVTKQTGPIAGTTRASAVPLCAGEAAVTDSLPSTPIPSTRTRPSTKTSGGSRGCTSAPTSLTSWGTRLSPRRISRSPRDGTGRGSGRWSLRGGKSWVQGLEPKLLSSGGPISSSLDRQAHSHWSRL